MNDGLATPTPGRLRDERGSSMIAVVMVMTMLLVLTGTAFSVTQQLGRSVKETTKSQQAFAAASAGIDRALTRINTYKPAAADCVTDVVAAPVSGGWCAAAPTESLGRGASFTYRVSASPSGVAACGGVTLNNATGDRCLVATGTVDGLSRRVAARLAISTNSITFSTSTSVVGYKEVKIKKKGKIIGNISANHRFKIEKDGILTGTLSLGPKGKVQGWAGTPIRLPSPLVPNLPNFAIFDPVSGTVRDSATTNNNLTAASNPKVVYNATKRELTVPDGIVLTLPPGVYNFCKLTLGKGAKISVVKPQAGAAVPLDAVRLFIDGRERAGSRCTSDGELDSRTGASFVNGSNDPRALQIFAWGKRTKLKVGNAQDFAGIIYAPRSSVKFNATGKFTGGVAGQRVEVHKDMQVINSNLLSTWTSPMSEITQVVSWRQCLKGGLPADPYDRCPTA